MRSFLISAASAVASTTLIVFGFRGWWPAWIIWGVLVLACGFVWLMAKQDIRRLERAEGRSVYAESHTWEAAFEQQERYLRILGRKSFDKGREYAVSQSGGDLRTNATKSEED